MTTLNIAYSANTAIVMDLSALASSSTFLAGRESTQIDNTSNKYVDALVQGKIIVGSTPTLPCQANIYVWGSDVSLATTPIDTLDGTDSAETLTNTTVLTNSLVLARSIPILVATSDLTYFFEKFSVAALFGGLMPKFWGIFFAHNMTAALKTDAGNTNSFSFNGITFTNA